MTRAADSDRIVRDSLGVSLGAARGQAISWLRLTKRRFAIAFACGVTALLKSKLRGPCPIHPSRRPRSQAAADLAGDVQRSGQPAAPGRDDPPVRPGCSILVVDDNSPDGTGRIADELCESLTDVTSSIAPGKLGLGTATLAAMRFAIEHGFDYLLNLDADFSHPPRFIPGLLAGMANHDVMIGSRYVPGGGVEGGFHAQAAVDEHGINSYARLMLGLKKGQQRRFSLLPGQQAGGNRSRPGAIAGYSFQEEILYWCQRVGCRIGETPILFENRRAGSLEDQQARSRLGVGILLQLGLSRFGRT